MVRIYRLTDESWKSVMDALEQAEEVHNNRISLPGDEESELAEDYARLQRVLLWHHDRGVLIEGTEEWS